MLHIRKLAPGFACALALFVGSAQAQVAATKTNPVKGAIDFHVHSGPDISARNLSDVELAGLAARYEMRAIVLKNHVTMTADRASLVAQMAPGVEVFGGIVLNKAVGGLNASAVHAMAKMSGGRGRVVWLPSFDSGHHRATFANKEDGIRVAADGKVNPDTEQVLQAIKEHDLILETGHASPDEVLTVLRRAKDIGIDKVIVTHAMSQVPGLNREQLKEAASLGAYLELVYLDHLRTPTAHLEWLREWQAPTIEDMAQAVLDVGADHFIVASDLGQTGNPVHPDGMVEMVTGLMKAGVSEQDIGKMVRSNPAALLGLD